jgi:hypothetical protein
MKENRRVFLPSSLIRQPRKYRQADDDRDLLEGVADCLASTT